MTPLQQIALGFVVIVLTAPAGEVDLLLDPVGWMLVLGGVLRLRTAAPRPLPHSGLVTLAAVVAALASVALAVPPLVRDASPAQLAPLVVWQPLCCAALCRSLSGLAPPSAPWAARLRWLAYAFCVVAALPLVVLADVEEAYGAVAFAGAVALLVLIVVLFVVHRAPWIHRVPVTPTASPS
jgi:hypothetical protein